MDFKELIRIVPDFPKQGISFKDITTLLKDPEGYKAAIDELVAICKDLNADVIVGPEARGFLTGAPLAYALGKGFVLIRKPGKLPSETEKIEYALEYGTDQLEIHKDAIKPGQKVILVDDLLATGGTALATTQLVEKLGAEVVGLVFLIELTGLNGREKLKGYHVQALVDYEF
jgi:adenine phosphoribosyltransferase